MIYEKLKALIDSGGVYLGSCDVGYALWWNGKQYWSVDLNASINSAYDALMKKGG